MPFNFEWKMAIRRTGSVMLVVGVVVVVSLILMGEFEGVWGQISELGSDRVTLKTVDSGSFVGQRKVVETLEDPNELPRSYFTFRGIPYAQPPLGVEGRWQPPRPLEPRRSPRMATEWKPPCSQWHQGKRKVVGSQDCLYLNVFTPYVPSTVRRPLPENTTSWTIESRNLLPVLVYVHGGEWLSGSADQFEPDRFMTENVVLVTFNYRLGLLGFLSHKEGGLKGNYGLMDQLAALRWVQDNIYRFGGNPLRVAVFGNVEHLLLVQGAKGLFTSAIICPVSTSLLSPTLAHDEDEGTETGNADWVQFVAQEVGCPTKGEAMTECLKITEVDSLIRVQQRALKFFNHPVKIGPVVDNELLVSSPETLLKEGRYLTNLPVMIGSSGYEGFAPFLEFYEKLFQESRESDGKDADTEPELEESKAKDKLKETLRIILLGDEEVDDGEFSRVFESVWGFYFGTTTTPKPMSLTAVGGGGGNGTLGAAEETQARRMRWKLFRVFGDLTFHSGQRKLVQLLGGGSKAPVFNYVFNHSIEHFEEYLEQQVQQGSKNIHLHSTTIPPWKELYYLFPPVEEEARNQNHNLISTNSSHNHENHDPGQIELSSSMRIKPWINATAEDEKLSHLLVKLWVSFANYGSPKQAVGKFIQGAKWSRVVPGHLNYFVLGNQPKALNAEFRKAESKFWMSMLPRIRALSEKIRELEPFPLLFWIFVSLTTLLTIIALTLICCICCSARKSKDELRYEEDNVVFLNRILTQRPSDCYTN